MDDAKENHVASPGKPSWPLPSPSSTGGSGGGVAGRKRPSAAAAAALLGDDEKGSADKAETIPTTRRRAVDVLRQLPERNRFMKGLFAWVGFNSVGVPYERPERAAGTTKFNFWRLWNFAIDGVVSFSTAPLRAWFYVGLVIATVAVLYALFIITRVLIFGVDTPGYASLLIAVLLMGAIQLLSLGIIGEYLGRLFVEVKGRPIYVVEGIYEGVAPEPPAV